MKCPFYSRNLFNFVLFLKLHPKFYQSFILCCPYNNLSSSFSSCKITAVSFYIGQRFHSPTAKPPLVLVCCVGCNLNILNTQRPYDQSQSYSFTLLQLLLATSSLDLTYLLASPSVCLQPKQAILLYALVYQHITFPIFFSLNNSHVLALHSVLGTTIYCIQQTFAISIHISDVTSVLKTYPTSSEVEVFLLHFGFTLIFVCFNYLYYVYITSTSNPGTLPLIYISDTQQSAGLVERIKKHNE